MRRIFTILLLATVAAVVAAPAQDKEPEKIILTELTTASIGKVWMAIKRSMEEVGCAKAMSISEPESSTEDGPLKAKWVSEYCILQSGTDSVVAYIKRYSELPRIRGGIWRTCRVQYTVNVKEVEDSKVKIILRAEMSGFEEYIEQRVLFWPSNGILEREMMARILKYSTAEAGN